MKNNIYLIFIAALFSGCMGNSFRTQRYTNFRHAPKHIVEECQSFVREQAPPKPKQIKVSENSGPLSCSASAEAGEGVTAKARTPRKPASTKSIFSKTAIKDLVKESKPLEIKQGRSLNEKEFAAKGLIGAVLKIVLLAVILAVVVGIIILVVIL